MNMMTGTNRPLKNFHRNAMRMEVSMKRESVPWNATLAVFITKARTVEIKK